MLEILISMIGFVIILRILTHLQKFEVLNQKKVILLFCIFQLPIYLPLIFKELFLVSITYIGIFLLSLIFLQKILTFYVKRTFNHRCISFIDEIILLMKTGKSAQSSLKTIYKHLSEWEKLVFKPSLFCFEHEKVSLKSILKCQQFYFQELEHILQSSAKVIDQLISFRDGLKIQRNLRHRSRQVTQQIRAQAIVAIFIYIGIFLLSWHSFQLKSQPMLILLSFILFVIGEILIFWLGGRIKWKT